MDRNQPNPVHTGVLESINDAIDAKILSSIPEEEREFIRTYSHSHMVRELAKDGRVIAEELTPARFEDLGFICIDVINAGNELDIVKKRTIYNKDLPLPGPRQFNTDLVIPGLDSLTPEKAHLLHMAIGLAGEAAEMLEAIFAHVYEGQELDRENVVEEAGDALFYLQGLLQPVQHSISHALLANKVKLKGKRYKDGYSDAAAQTRADKEPGK